MKNQALLFWKDKSKTLTCRLLQFLFGALRVKKYSLDIWPIFIYIYSPVISNDCYPKVNFLGAENLL